MIRVSAFADEAAEDLAGQISALGECGIHRIDVRSVDGKNVSEMTEREAELAAAELRRAGISVSCLGSPLGKSSLSEDFSAVEERAERIFRNARAFGTDKVRVFSFYDAKGRFEEVAARMTRLVALARKRGVTLLHENELGIYGERVADVLRLRSVWGLGFLYDPANYVLAGEDIEVAERTAGLSGYIHIKDARYTGEIVPAGRGDGKIGDLVSEGRDLTLTLEPHLASFGGYAGLTGRELKHSEFVYASPRAAFAAAAEALFGLLRAKGYYETEKGWSRV